MIAVRQFQQEILPPPWPRTTVWGYGSPLHQGTFNYPAFTIEATHGRPVRVRWVNDLVAADGSFLPHLLPVDPTLLWANPPGGTAGRDTRHPRPLEYHDPITENPALGSTEVWELYNFTEDAHPIHIHEVQFQVADRQPFGRAKARPPERWETGFKDTVIAYPGEITRVRAYFDLPGRFVWHCHILEHEDHEMMRPYLVGGG